MEVGKVKKRSRSTSIGSHEHRSIAKQVVNIPAVTPEASDSSFPEGSDASSISPRVDIITAPVLVDQNSRPITLSSSGLNPVVTTLPTTVSLNQQKPRTIIGVPTPLTQANLASSLPLKSSATAVTYDPNLPVVHTQTIPISTVIQPQTVITPTTLPVGTVVQHQMIPGTTDTIPVVAATTVTNPVLPKPIASATLPPGAVIMPTTATTTVRIAPPLIDTSSPANAALSIAFLLFDILKFIIYGTTWFIALVFTAILQSIQTLIAIAPYFPSVISYSPVLLPRLPQLYPHLISIIPYLPQLSPHLPRLLPYARVLLPYSNLWLPHLPVLLPHMNILIPYINSLHNQLPYILPYTAYFAPHLPQLAPHLPQLIPHFPHILPYLPESQEYIPKLVVHTKSFLPYMKDIEQNISMIVPNLKFIVTNLDDFLPYLDSLCPHMSYFLPFLGKVEDYYPTLRQAGIHKFLENVEDFVPDLGIIVANLKYITPELNKELTVNGFEHIHKYAQVIMKEYGWGMKYTAKYLGSIPSAVAENRFAELLHEVHAEKMKVLGLQVGTSSKSKPNYNTTTITTTTTYPGSESGSGSEKKIIKTSRKMRRGDSVESESAIGEHMDEVDREMDGEGGGIGDGGVTDSSALSGDLGSFDGMEEDERNGSDGEVEMETADGGKKKMKKRQKLKNFFHRKGHGNKD